ncbi:MAG: pseudouridine synthase, partial [Acidimicrobiia bacterium]
MGQRVDPSAVHVEVDGLPLPLAPDLASYLVYKPVGTVSTADDPQGRPTVVELVPATNRVYPAGRLDADSEGLMILTNDGDLTLRITH